MFSDEITEVTGNENIIIRHLDLSNMSSVRKFAEEVNRSEPKIDILVIFYNSKQYVKIVYFFKWKFCCYLFQNVFLPLYIINYLVFYFNSS